jgi:AraC-like DNA-binding protein
VLTELANRGRNGTRRVSARLLAPVVRYLAELGVEAGSLFREAGLPQETISDPDTRVSSHAMRDLLVLAAQRCNDPAFGLHAGQRLRPGDLGLLEYLVRTSASSQEIAHKLVRYHELAGNLAPQIEQDGDTLVCHLPVPESEHHPPVVEEYNLSFWAKLARAVRDDALRPLEVRFTHEEPAYAKDAALIFGAPVRFDCERNGLVFARESLVGVAPVDEGLRRAVIDRADEALTALGSHCSTGDRVRAQLRVRLLDDGATADSIARMLSMSARTLRRRLSDEGTRFQDLRDAVRRERALECISQEQLAISEIAYLLGFGETSAFHRAFRRWTGKTPAQYRRELRGAGTSF